MAASAASLKVQVPAYTRQPCEGAPLPPRNASEPDYQVFGLRQTVRLELCEGRRALSVEAADLHNQQVDRLVNELRPLTFWERIFGRKR